MIKKLLLSVVIGIFVIFVIFTPNENNMVHAKTMWGKVELKKGMIGKVKIVKDTYQYSISKKTLKKGTKLKKGKEYGVYSYSKSYGGLYKIGDNKFVKKSSSIKYYKAPKDLSTSENAKINDEKVVLIEIKVKGGSSQGSGVIVGNGLILTNEHVIDGMIDGTITTSNGTEYAIEGIVVSDKTKDLALLKTSNKIRGIGSVKIGSYKNLEKGDKIVAIGSPLGLQNTVSEGIVSSFRLRDGVQQIQISVPIDHGSSGGGLFNSKGELVGITSRGMESNADLNFAVAIDEISNWKKFLNMDFEDVEVVEIDKSTESTSFAFLGNISLGMTKEQVKKAETSTLVQEDYGTLIYTDKHVLGYSAEVNYEFENNKLVAVNIFHDVVNNRGDLDTLEAYFIVMLENLANIYGEPNLLDTNWFDDKEGYILSAYWDSEDNDLFLISHIELDYSSYGGIRISIK